MDDKSFEETDGLAGQLLVAMPQMQDPRFARTVIYMCAHTPEGAMGLVVNRLVHSITFPDLLEQLGVEPALGGNEIRVHFGGPVESGRGFVLHTSDYHENGTLVVAENVALTVGSPAQLRHAADRASANPLVIKLRSSMRRHGFAPDDLPRTPHLPDGPLAYAIHPPLAGSDEDHIAEVERWLPSLDPRVPVQVSHLGAPAFATLRDAHADRTFRIRLGTRLWHGDKSTMHLRADVLDTHTVTAGTAIGYRANRLIQRGGW